MQSDALSRRPDFTPKEDTDNENITMLPNELFISLIDTELQDQILACEKLDSDAMEALKVLLEEGPTTIQNQLPDWTVERVEGKQILYYRGKNYIPKDENLRKDIARMFHDHPTAGHPGELETYNSIRQHYWWPGLRTYVKNYCTSKGVEYANNSRLTDNRRSPPFFQRKELSLPGLLRVVPWTSSRTFPR